MKELLVDDGGLPLDRFLLLPLDITTPHELKFPFYTTSVDSTFTLGGVGQHSQESVGNSPLVHFSSAFLERTREVMREFGKDAMEYVGPPTYPVSRRLRIFFPSNLVWAE